MLDSFYISIVIAGFGGGMVRSLFGYAKQFNYKSPKFKIKYFLFMTFLSGIIGLFAAVISKELGLTFLGINEFTPALAFMVGYAGGDVLEGVYKVVIDRFKIT